MQRTTVWWLWSLLFPRMASNIFLQVPHSADRPFGVRNTQSLCIMFLKSFASLSCTLPDLMAALSNLGVLTLWPPDVEILPQACLRTSSKWQCVCKVIMWVDSSVFVLHINKGGFHLQGWQYAFGSVKSWVEGFNIVKYHLFNCRNRIFTWVVKFVLFSYFPQPFIYGNTVAWSTRYTPKG